MDRYPKLILTCEGAGVYVLGAGKNPMAEVRRLGSGETVGCGPMQLMSIVAHIDLGEWDEVPGTDSTPQTNPYPLSADDLEQIRQTMRVLLRIRRDLLRARYGHDLSAQMVLEFVFDRSNWESLGLSEGLDQGFRHLVREEQLELIAPLLGDLGIS